MMEDRLEKYIREQRDAFDDKAPPASSWDKIAARVKPTPTTSTLKYWQAAAVIFFVMALGLVIKNYQATDDNNLAVSESVQEFKTTEEYYFDVIESQQGLLTSYLDEYPELAKDFKTDLAELSQNYTKLKQDFAVTGDKEVLNALIKNLQLQQALLQNQVEIIQQIEQENENLSI